ncbi:MAG TPA: hypothetical protein VK139_06330 [Microbacteriaceae bacterium]|nr:hypothetical protein [Microbacteriaceae bacterium]
MNTFTKEPNMEETSTPTRKRYLLPLTSIVGIGAVLTLAAWTATSYLSGTFKTATYTGMLYSVDGTNWKDAIPASSSDASPDTLQVTYPGLGAAIAPGATAAVPLALRAAAGTTGPIGISIDTKVTTGNPIGISYELIAVSDWASCTPTATGTSLVDAGTSIVEGSTPTGTRFRLAAAAPTGGAQGAPTWLCLKVSASSSMIDSSTVGVKWIVTGSI